MSSSRESYILARNSGNLGTFLMNEYYTKCKECVTREEFSQFFPLWFSRNSEKVLQKLDNEHNVIKVYNKNNQLIKFV